MSNLNDAIQYDPYAVSGMATPTGRFDWTGFTANRSHIWTASAVEIVDDYPNDFSTTAGITVGGSITGQIEPGYDQDWFQVNLTTGRIYAFDLKGAASGGGTLPDSDLRLIDPSGNYVTFDWDSGIGPDARMLYSQIGRASCRERV